MWLGAALIIGATVAISFAMTGAYSPATLPLAMGCIGAQIGRRRRLARPRLSGEIARPQTLTGS